MFKSIRLILLFSLLVLCTTLNAETITILGGNKGNANFELSKNAAGSGTFVDTPHWFNASGSEDIEFTTDTFTTGSSSPNSRACIPFHNRFQVNDTGYTVTRAGEIFSMSFDFGRTGENWDGDESYRAFLFSTPSPVDELLSVADINEVASIEYQVPLQGIWDNQVQFNSFFITSDSDIGRTLFMGMVLANRSGSQVSPRLDEIHLVVEFELLLGDVNLDGFVDLLDINPFVDLMLSSGFQLEADINQDGVVDLLDVAPFVEVLASS